ncbi:MAG: ABC-2 type transport system permease protein, partial [Flavobacterium sp.]
MFLEMLKFELNYHRKQNLIYILSGVFFMLTFLATTTPNVQMVGGVSNLNINASYTILVSVSSLVLMSLFGSIAFSANAIIRDFDLNTAEMFLTRPLSKFDYLYGRFFGSLFYAYIIYFAGMLGFLVGEFMPWLDPERIGPHSLDAYFYGTWLIAIPNLFLFSSMFFCIATVTRSMMATYIGVVALLMITFLVDSFTDKDTVMMTSILDPFGSAALEVVTRYWTVFEKNSNLPIVEGALLVNRLLWLALGIAFAAAAYPLFTFSIEHSRKHSRKHSRLNTPPDAQLENEEKDQNLSRLIDDSIAKFDSGKLALPSFDFPAQFKQYVSQTRFEILNIVKSATFAIVLLLGIFLIVANAVAGLGPVFGTSVYPTTSVMVQIINGAFSLSLLVVLIFYSGELMVRERNVKVNEIMDSMPYPNWIMIAAKLTSLVMVVISMLLTAMIAAIGVQIYSGYYDIDIVQYLLGLLFFFQFPLYLMIVLAVFFYVVSRNKFVAMFLMIVYFVVSLALPALGFEHYLYRMRQVAPIYSDLTGYGHNLLPYLWQTFYWGIFGSLLLLVIHLLWPRGSEDDWVNRIRVMRQRINKPFVVATWGLSTALVLVGSFIFYNTNILNDYVTGKDLEAKRVEYEKNYKKHQYKPMPQIQEVYAEVDLFPSEQALALRGSYVLLNSTMDSQSEIHFTLPLGVTVNELNVPTAKLESEGDENYRIYTLDKPLLPGEIMKVTFEIDWLTPGFANNGHSASLASNGTFVRNSTFFPLIGYQSQTELGDNNDRRKFDLPPLERAAKIDDEDAWNRSFLGGPRVTFETIVSTDLDQIAIAPGYLQKEWEEKTRKYFHYKMDNPIWNYYSYNSGRYEVKRDEWNDVAIEVYYHHDYNIDVMVQSTKDALDYFSNNFSPYQYRQFRILEFPSFQGSFAESFPNTIPFSESIGFTADLRDKKEIDYVYYVTAHELAHQWWAHQVLGASVQGSSMIVETLAQYSALMVMKKTFGEASMKRFLSYELDRYLQGRGGELIDEMPLFLVENQPYIHYRKGSVALYALQDYVGEENLNEVLQTFIEDYAFKGPPYPTTKNLLALMREKFGSEHETLITDLFEKIVLYDLKVEDSEIVELENGQFDVTITVSALKYEADGAGIEKEIPLKAWIDIGVLGEKQGESEIAEVIYLEKHIVNQSPQSFKIRVDKKPVSVGIDPMNKLIDRNP